MGLGLQGCCGDRLMGISYEKWATCDECEEQKSYHMDDEDDPPYGFYWNFDRSKLYCADCYTDGEAF